MTKPLQEMDARGGPFDRQAARPLVGWSRGSRSEMGSSVHATIDGKATPTDGRCGDYPMGRHSVSRSFRSKNALLCAGRRTTAVSAHRPVPPTQMAS